MRGDAGLTLTAYVIIPSFGPWFSTGEPLAGMGLVMSFFITLCPCSRPYYHEKSESFDILTKGSLITVEGHFKPEEWTDADGVKHNRVILVATRFYPVADKEQKAEKQEKES